MALPRKSNTTYHLGRIELNLWDIEGKKIIFTGTSGEIAVFLKCPQSTVRSAYLAKNKMYGKYAIRATKADKTEDQIKKVDYASTSRK
jgi:hypothetical protein